MVVIILETFSRSSGKNAENQKLKEKLQRKSEKLQKIEHELKQKNSTIETLQQTLNNLREFTSQLNKQIEEEKERSEKFEKLYKETRKKSLENSDSFQIPDFPLPEIPNEGNNLNSRSSESVMTAEPEKKNALKRGDFIKFKLEGNK
jgi:predicted nuclease with TOPRIM domain